MNLWRGIKDITSLEISLNNRTNLELRKGIYLVGYYWEDSK
jgi:hypothetical protein